MATNHELPFDFAANLNHLCEFARELNPAIYLLQGGFKDLQTAVERAAEANDRAAAASEKAAAASEKAAAASEKEAAASEKAAAASVEAAAASDRSAAASDRSAAASDRSAAASVKLKEAFETATASANPQFLGALWWKKQVRKESWWFFKAICNIILT
ncbi:hypothetical protein EDC01DRAFT_758112 [Geopyxis carbonaria]|nr:hypothetical protein EDC01DRAFT_758112 [Geopyxis carbonaria]